LTIVAAAGGFALFLVVGVTAVDSLARVNLVADWIAAGVEAPERAWIRRLVAAAGGLALGLCLGETAISPGAWVNVALWWAW
jgi:hypothetical protein